MSNFLFAFVRYIYPSFISMFSVNLKSDLEGSGSNPMSHAYCVARQFSGKHTPAFWKGPGFKSGTGHGGEGVNDRDTCEEKAYDKMRTQTQDVSQTVQILWPLS